MTTATAARDSKQRHVPDWAVDIAPVNDRIVILPDQDATVARLKAAGLEAPVLDEAPPARGLVIAIGPRVDLQLRDPSAIEGLRDLEVGDRIVYSLYGFIDIEHTDADGEKVKLQSVKAGEVAARVRD